MMKRLKGFGVRRRNFELPPQLAAPCAVPTQDTQVRNLKKISQVVGIDSPPIVSTPRHEGHHEFRISTTPERAKESVDSHSRPWRNPFRVKVISRGSSFSSTSEAPSSRLSDANLNSSPNMSNGDQGGRRAVVVAFDANARDAVVAAVAWTLKERVVRAGDVLALLGVMDYLRGPLGYKCQVNDQTWLGTNAKHLQKELALKKLAWAATPGLQTLCADRGVKLLVNVKAAAHPEVVIVQDAVAFGAVQVVLDRSLKIHNPRKQKFYLEHLSCEVTRMRRNGGAEILRSSSHTAVSRAPTATTVTTTSTTVVTTFTTSTTGAAAAAPAAIKPPSDDEELFTIDHCVASTPRVCRSDEEEKEEGYESDDLFSIGDVESAWRTSSFAAQLIQQRGGHESSARNSTVSTLDRDLAMASFAPPRSSVDSGPRLDKRLLSLRLQLHD